MSEDSSTNDNHFKDNENEEHENTEFSSGLQKPHPMQYGRNKRGANFHTRSMERAYTRERGTNIYNRNLSRDNWNPHTTRSYNSSFYYNSTNTNSRASNDNLTWQQRDLLKGLNSHK